MTLLVQHGGIEVGVTPEEIVLFSNVLNEVCHGFRLAEFDRSIGGSRAEARELLHKLSTLSADQPTRIMMTVHELALLQNALKESLRELGTEEFATRTGTPFELGEDRLRQLRAFTSELHAE